jgi:hypothetical protein
MRMSEVGKILGGTTRTYRRFSGSLRMPISGASYKLVGIHMQR